MKPLKLTVALATIGSVVLMSQASFAAVGCGYNTVTSTRTNVGVKEGTVGNPANCPNEHVMTETSPNNTYGSTQCPNFWIVQTNNPYTSSTALFQVDFATPPSQSACSGAFIELSVYANGGLTQDTTQQCVWDGFECNCGFETYMPVGSNVRAVAAAYVGSNRNSTRKVKITTITDCGL